jgi:site-specific recombinase
MLGLRLFPPMKEATAGSERERHLLFSPFIFLPHAVVIVVVHFFLSFYLAFLSRTKKEESSSNFLQSSS